MLLLTEDGLGFEELHVRGCDEVLHSSEPRGAVHSETGSSVKSGGNVSDGREVSTSRDSLGNSVRY